MLIGYHSLFLRKIKIFLAKKLINSICILSRKKSSESEIISIADTFRDAGDTVQAAKYYEMAIDIRPERHDLKIQLGNMLKDSRELKKAEAVYTDLISQDEYNAEAYLQLGHLFRLSGRNKDAQNSYKKSAAINPQSPAAIELALSGDRIQQENLFDAQVRLSYLNPILELSAQIEEIKKSVINISNKLPNIKSQIAFPIRYFSVFDAIYNNFIGDYTSHTTITIIIKLDSENLKNLYKQLESIRSQKISSWKLIVIGSSKFTTRPIQNVAKIDPRITWVEAGEDSNFLFDNVTLIENIDSDIILFLEDETEILSNSLGALFYAFDNFDSEGYIADEYRNDGIELKSIVDYESLLESNPYGFNIAVKTLYYKKFLKKIKLSHKPIEPYAGNFVFSRSLFVLDIALEGKLGHIPAFLFKNSTTNHISQAIHENAVKYHLTLNNLDSRIKINYHMEVPVTWIPHDEKKTISVIIPTKNNSPDTYVFVESLFSHADHPDNLRILIIDNGSDEGKHKENLISLSERDNVELIHIDIPFNWSHLNNKAVNCIEAEYVIFANDDMKILTKGWDSIIRGYLSRDDVGIVGAKLLYPDDTIQHAGILLNWHPTTSIHDGLFEKKDEKGPLNRWASTRCVSAVTGAFLATKTEVFRALSGFDEENLGIAFSDIDYALKVRKIGLKVIWTPFIGLYHLESKSRGLDHLDVHRGTRFESEKSFMKRKWGRALEMEPSVNPLWHNSILPFQLISMYSEEEFYSYMKNASLKNPWIV